MYAQTTHFVLVKNNFKNPVFYLEQNLKSCIHWSFINVYSPFIRGKLPTLISRLLFLILNWADEKTTEIVELRISCPVLPRYSTSYVTYLSTLFNLQSILRFFCYFGIMPGTWEHDVTPRDVTPRDITLGKWHTGVLFAAPLGWQLSHNLTGNSSIGYISTFESTLTISRLQFQTQNFALSF